MPATTCPSFESLSRFRLGLLSEPDVPELEAHLHTCESCLKRLPPSQGDPLVRGLRQQHNKPRLNNPVMEQLRQELRAKPPSAQPWENPTLGDVVPSESATLADSPSSNEQAYEFLEPPKGEGEIGWLGTYRVLRVLGEGGMGMVLQAEDTQLGRNVALKVMKPSIAAESSARKRFAREARAQAALEHDHIITIHHIDEINGTPFLAMPLLQGETLDGRLKREEVLPLSEVLRIGRETALALAAAHDKDLIHRDIKPANLWLEAPSGRVKVLDFGLAAMPCPEDDKTLPGTILGTPGYMAPEQSESEANPQSDLFSLGCVLYRMATGKAPFEGDTPLKKIRSVLVDTPESPLKINPSLPAPFCNLVLRLLSKKPDDRPATATAVARVLETLAGPAPGAIRAPVAQIVRTPPRTPTKQPAPSASDSNVAPSAKPDRRMLYWGVGVASTLLLVGLTTLLIWGLGSPDDSTEKPPVKQVTEGRVHRPFVANPQRKEGSTRLDVENDKPAVLRGDAIFKENWVLRPPKIQDLIGWTVQPKNVGYYYPYSFDFTKDERLFVQFYPNQSGSPYWRQFDPTTNGLTVAPFGGRYTDLSQSGRTCLRSINGGVEIFTDANHQRPKTTIFKLGASFATEMSPNAKLIATIDSSNGGFTYVIWITDGNGDEFGEVRQPGRTFSPRDFAWSPDSTTFAVLDSVAGIALIRSPWTKVTKTISRPQSWHFPVWSPNSAYLAIVDKARKLCIIDIEKAREAAKIPEYNVVTAPAWSPDGTELAFGTDDRKVIVWNLEKQKATYTFSGHTRTLTCVAFLGDGRTLVSGSRGSCRFWDLKENAYRGALLLLPGSHWLAISPDGNYACSRGGESYFVMRTRTVRDKVDYTPAEFYDRFGWKNDPKQVQLTNLEPPE